LLHQFTVQAAPQVLPGGGGSNEFARTLDPLLAMASISQHLRSVSDAGRDTVRQSGGPVAVRRLLVEYEPDTAYGAPHMHPRMLWIDEAHQLLARDSLMADIHNDQSGAMTMVQDTRFVIAQRADGGPDSLYRFTSPAGSRRVSRLGAPGMDPPDLSGKPAADFTLGALDGTRVTLSKLRGHVVVLDFWATWCGPCRRWMPIVAKLHRETRLQGVHFYGVNLRETTAQVRTFLASNKLVVPVLLDHDGAIGEKYGAQSIPLTVVIGKNGTIVRALLGLHPEDDLRTALREAGVTGI
jgi:thiol-disulfide isomerase/thioredoxin